MTAQGAASPPKHRSFSQVKQLRTCGFSYKLERIDRVPSRPSVPAVAGVAVHSGTEEVDRLWSGATASLTARGLETARASFDEQVEKLTAEGWPPETWRSFGRGVNNQDAAWFREQGLANSINAYVAWRSENDEAFELVDIPGFGPAIELPFNYYIGAQLVHGFIDRVFRHRRHGTLHPFDLKSGLKPKTDEQLGLYARAIDAGLGWQMDFGYYLYGLKTGTAKLTDPIALGHWTTEKLNKVYGPATLAINTGIFMPAPGEACFLCSVTEHCEFYRSVI